MVKHTTNTEIFVLIVNSGWIIRWRVDDEMKLGSSILRFLFSGWKHVVEGIVTDTLPEMIQFFISQDVTTQEDFTNLLVTSRGIQRISFLKSNRNLRKKRQPKLSNRYGWSWSWEEKEEEQKCLKRDRRQVCCCSTPAASSSVQRQADNEGLSRLSVRKKSCNLEALKTF